MTRDSVVAVMVVHNELHRLPFFLDYHRGLGIRHFLVIDNASTDGTGAFLARQPDVSLWETPASYRAARFGLDWVTWLQMRYCHNRWCLMLDADELFVFAHCDSRSITDLTAWLDSQNRRFLGALMLDLYPKGPLGTQEMSPGEDPRKILCWFDNGPYRSQRQMPMQNLWVQGGARERIFFTDDPRRSPTLNKLPLMRWNRRFAFVNSCHSVLPSRFNFAYSGPGRDEPSAVLLHTKFIPDILDRTTEEKQRGQHFHHPDQFQTYYQDIARQPDLWFDGSVRLGGWRQLVDLGLMSDGGW
ncbi:glycosyltransferase family 2 protein [Arenibacterium sp. CAU 1754]